jgi:hypothetical protein
LKQARHRASRLFLKEGERSSLPQYLQTNFSALEVARDDRRGRCAAFLAFEARAAFDLAATAFFFAAGTGLLTGGGLGGQAIILPLSLTNPPAACLVSVFT